MNYYLIHTPTTLRMKGKGVKIHGILAYKVNDVYFNVITNKRIYPDQIKEVQTFKESKI